MHLLKYYRKITINKSMLILFFALIISSSLSSQITKIIGHVTDSLTGEAIPFTNVFLIGTSIGTTTGFDGKFSIETTSLSDTLIASIVGYNRFAIHIKSGSFQELNIKLLTKDEVLNEVVIRPGENPAHIILAEVIANKAKNRMNNVDYYQVEVYNKIQFDANNINDKFKSRRVFKPFQFVFENIDTSALNGKSYLPMLITESVSDFYYRKSPELRKEVIKASRASGIKNESVSQFLGNMYQQVDIYDNYNNLFDKNFASPIADFGLRYYRYYLVDSANLDGNWCYKIMFKPRRQKELTFTGQLWIADTSFAVKEVDIKIVDDLNINFINAMEINQKYFLIDSKYWLLSNDNILIDFNVVDNTKKLTGFYAHKSTSYKNYKINIPAVNDIYKAATNVDVAYNAFYRSENYWDSIRPYKLNLEERKIYKMVDTITDLPIFKTYYDIIAMITTGYYGKKNFDLGPYFQTISFNSVEGLRLRLGGRTSSLWNDKLRIFGNVAYGTKDNEFKYGGGFLYLFDNNPRRGFGMEYKRDLEQLGQSVNALQQDNIIASIFRRRPFTKLTMVEQYKLNYEHEWFNGFSSQLTFRRRKIFPLADDQFVTYNGNVSNVSNNIITSELEFNTRFAYKEIYLIDKFSRTSMGTKYPVFNIWYSYGLPNKFESSYSYHKLRLTVDQWFSIGSLGWSRYILSAGKIWGILPFPLLEIHPGNETYSYDKYAFNKMNYYEFISDQYLTFSYSHHFDGFFLNHIPFLRALEWREVAYFKGIFGSLSPENQKFSKFLDNSGWLTNPYYETGLAIENIFKVLRIDAGWRLSYLDNADIQRFGLMLTLYLSF